MKMLLNSRVNVYIYCLCLIFSFFTELQAQDGAAISFNLRAIQSDKINQLPSSYKTRILLKSENKSFNSHGFLINKFLLVSDNGMEGNALRYTVYVQLIASSSSIEIKTFFRLGTFKELSDLESITSFCVGDSTKTTCRWLNFFTVATAEPLRKFRKTQESENANLQNNYSYSILLDFLSYDQALFKYIESVTSNRKSDDNKMSYYFSDATYVVYVKELLGSTK